MGQSQFAALREKRERNGVEMAGRAKRIPARADDVAGMHDGGRKAGQPRLAQEVVLDCRLLRAVVAKRMAWLLLCGRNHGTGAMHPDGASVKEMLDLSFEGLDNMAGAVERETDHVDDDVRIIVVDRAAEGAVALAFRPVHHDGSHRTPGGMVVIRLAAAAADGDHVVSRLYQSRHEVSSDVTAGTDYDYA